MAGHVAVKAQAAVAGKAAELKTAKEALREKEQVSVNIEARCRGMHRPSVLLSPTRHP